ncbi:MAG: sigma 54-interacting transcriptional regulator [Candidatus Aminicenantes bacterium]|jgi:DNA-binding NtrC family response regulator
MKTLPRILIIDDVYGQEKKEQENFCLRLGLKNPLSDLEVGEPIAEAVFCRGQVETDGQVKNDLEGTLKFIKNGWMTYPRWALVLLDLHFDTGNYADREPEKYFGLTILKALNHAKEFNDLPVIILSAMDRSPIETIFSEHGALGFVDKSRLNRTKLQELLFHHGLVQPLEEEFIGQSIEFLKCLREARKRARIKDGNILILGENGTGKELLAEYIHRQSGRIGEFKLLFTQGVPENLIEDLLFGHVKGAFTDAKSDQAGAAELADKGTLFIDEFGNIPASIQPKLLRLLDKKTREIQRLGSQKPKKLDLLVVMATNKLDVLSSDDFRKDLLFRVNASNPILLPPLRERKEDILLLAEFFTRKFEKDFIAQPRNISNEARGTLLSYHWPGNIRELETVIENSVYNYKELRTLSANHLKLERGLHKKSVPIVESREIEEPVISSLDVKRIDFNSIVEILTTFGFEHFKKEDLKGKLPQFQDAYALFLARYLIAAFKATLTYTSKKPGGEISYHPAIKLITNDFNMKATPAKRLLNNLLKISPGAIKELVGVDPILKEAILLYGDDKLKSYLEGKEEI